MMSSQAVEMMWICTGGYRQLRGEWVKYKMVTASVLLNKPNTKMPYMGEGVHTV